MRDLPIRALIPLAAAGTLVAVGCGGLLEEGENRGGSRSSGQESIPREIARGSCETSRDCDPAEFAESFDSVDDCIDEYDGEIVEYFDELAEETSWECSDAILELYFCASKRLDCDGTVESALFAEECSRNLDDAESVCEGLYDYYDYDDDYYDY